MSAPAERTWTPLSKALAWIDDDAKMEAMRRDLWARIAAGQLPYRYRYPSDQPGTYRYELLPKYFFELGRHNPVFDAVTYGDMDIWLVEISLPNLPTVQQADAPISEIERGRPSLADQFRDEATRLQQGGHRYKARTTLARAVLKRFEGVKGAGYKTIYKHLAEFWICP